MIYLIPLVVILVFILGYDTFDMNKLRGVGVRYLFRGQYWWTVGYRFLLEAFAVCGPFTAGNRYLSGDLHVTVNNFIGAVLLTGIVLPPCYLREEYASRNPVAERDPFAFTQRLKNQVLAAILQGRDEAVQRRLLRDRKWLLGKCNIEQLRTIYRRIYIAENGPYSGGACTQFLKDVRKECTGQAAFRQRLAEEIARASRLRWFHKFLRMFGRGRFRHNPPRRRRPG